MAAYFPGEPAAVTLCFVQAWTVTEPGSVTLAEVDEPEPGPDETVVAVQAFSPNRGETFVLERARLGFRPGKDIAGVVIKPSASGKGPSAGTRVVAHLIIPAGQSERPCQSTGSP